jgi:hypothetical protein
MGATRGCNAEVQRGTRVCACQVLAGKRGEGGSNCGEEGGGGRESRIHQWADPFSADLSLPALLCFCRRVLALTAINHRAGGPGHILNLGHGVIQETPEEAVGIFVDEAKKFKYADITAADAAAAREVVGV